MRSIFNVIKKAWFLSLLAIVLASLIIWFIGPLLAIADYKFLESSTIRFIVILIIVLAWGFNNLREKKTSKSEESKLSKELIDNNQKVDLVSSSPDEKIITERFNEAISTLQSAKLGKKNKLYSLPWYVIIGSPGSGKTTALKNSGLQFPLHSRFGNEPIQGSGGTRYCDWWFTNEAILIDTAGRYTTQEDSKKAEAKSWLSFLSTLKKGRPKRPLNGIILTISTEDILNKTNTQKSLHATSLKQRIQELNHQLNMELPVYVVLTKMDNIAGFSTFFEELEQEDREQVWGFNFSQKPIEKDKDFKSYFEIEFNKLIENLNHRVFYLLDHEKSQARRNLIHQFPYQANALKNPLMEFLNNIFTPNQFETPLIIRGMYFISSTQENMGSQWVTGALPTEKLNPPLDYHKNEAKTFFVNALFKNVIFKEANLANINHKSRQRFRWLYWTLASTSVALFLCVVLAWQHSRVQNQNTIKLVQSEINEYLKVTDGGLIDTRNWLSLANGLNHLRDLTKGYKQGSDEYPFSHGIGLYQGHKLGSEANNTYKKALHAFLMKDVGELLGNQILAANNDEHLYEALKFYLMPYHPDKMDKETFLIWIDILLKRELPGENNKILREQLNSHLQTALDENIAPVPLNQNIVEDARKTLVLTPIDLRLYRRLKSDHTKNNPGMFSLNDILGKKGEYIFYFNSGNALSEGIPNLFTFNGFHGTYNIQNKKLAERLASEQWIYGDSINEEFSDEDIQNITDKVDEYYFEEYVNYWQSLIDDLRIKSFGSVNEGQAVLRLLASSEKPLIKVIEAIKKNTALSQAPTLSDDQKAAAGQLADTFASSEKSRLEQLAPITTLGGDLKLPGHQVNQAFSSFNQYGQVEEGLPLTQLQQAINQLNNQFSSLANAGNIREAAFSASLQAESGESPILGLKRAVSEAHPDVQQWFRNTTNNANSVTAAAAKGHVNNTWKTEVYSFYEKAIAGRYPVDPSSNKDIKLSDFSEFFGPSGIMQNYFETNIKPFVDQSKSTWRWKKNIGISNTRLRVFQRADTIQKMFFSSENGSPGAGFLIKPLALDKITTGSLLEMGGQSIPYNHGPLRSQRFMWPGDSTKLSKLTFTLASRGTPVSSRTEGEWAWFRLLDRYATVENDNANDAIKLSFDLKGITAQYQLKPESSFNPFTSNVLDDFKIPSRL